MDITLTRKERTLNFLNAPDFLETVCSDTANGGSLIEYCKENDIRYSDVIVWIYQEPARSKVYEGSMRARGEWYVQAVLHELQKIGTSDIRKAFNPDGSLKNIHELPSEIASCISSIETVEEVEDDGSEGTETTLSVTSYVRKIKFWDKMRALELLGKNLKMFIERIEHSGPNGSPLLSMPVTVNIVPVTTISQPEENKKITVIPTPAV